MTYSEASVTTVARHLIKAMFSLILVMAITLPRNDLNQAIALDYGAMIFAIIALYTAAIAHIVCAFLDTRQLMRERDEQLALECEDYYDHPDHYDLVQAHIIRKNRSNIGSAW